MLNKVLENTVPVLIGAVIAFTGWVALGAARAQYDGLNRADEIRIVDGMQRYTDKQTDALKVELERIHTDIARLQVLQQQLLLAIQRENDQE